MKRRAFLQTTLAAPAMLLPAAAVAQRKPEGVRLSADDKDSDFDPIALSGQVTVTLDGQPAEHCITADEARGEVVCHVRNSFDRVVHRGKVEIHGLSKGWRDAYALRARVARLTVVK